MKARDLMVTDVARVRMSESLVEATARLMERTLDTGHEDVRCLIVVDDDDTPVHVLTEADVIRAILPSVFREPNFVEYISKWLASDLPTESLNEMFFDMARLARRKTVGDLVQDKPLVSVDPDASIVKIAYLMHQERIKTLPVVDNGALVGMVFRGAVFDVVAREILKNRDVNRGGELPPPATN